MRQVCLLFFLAVSIFACNKETQNEYGTVQLFLTTSTAPYEEVMVEIESLIFIHITNENKRTEVKLSNYQPGKYNLLEFSNGESTLLASSKIAPGRLSEIIIEFGENTVTTTDGAFDLKTTLQQNPKISIKIDQELNYEFNESIYLYFDVKNSVTEYSGSYYFEPAIRAFNSKSTGSIEGFIDPIASNPLITVTGGDHFFETNTESDGYFCFLGLEEGLYNITVTPETPFIEKSVPAILVSINEKMDLGIIQLNMQIVSTVSGDLNINPATSEENRFEMQTPSGLIDIDVIYAGGDDYTYSGAATEIKIMPKAQGRTLTINGTNIDLTTEVRSTITSTDAAMNVELRNTKNGNGSWWINITGENLVITPEPNISR